MTRCSILECKNDSSTKNLLQSGVSYHRFPKDPYIKEKWIAATGRINWMPTKSSCICSEHFAENEIIITKKGYRYIYHHVVPTRKIMTYKEETMTSNPSKNSIIEEPEPSPEPPTINACIEMDQLEKDPLAITEHVDEITTKSHEASFTNKSPSCSMYSTPRNKRLRGMLRWARSTITKKDLKIKRLQTQNRRLKRRLENAEKLIKTLEKKFTIPNENVKSLKNTNVEVCTKNQ